VKEEEEGADVMDVKEEATELDEEIKNECFKFATVINGVCLGTDSSMLMTSPVKQIHKLITKWNHFKFDNLQHKMMSKFKC